MFFNLPILYSGTRPFLIVMAVIPAIVLLILTYRSDRAEKEPAGLLVSLVLLGIVATFAAYVVEMIGDFITETIFPGRGLIYLIIENFIVVALTEEAAKYILLKVRTWKHPEFNFRFDGVVYAVFVSMGFALWENISYVISYGFSTALVRAVTAVPGHCCFGVFMGLFYGMAKKLSVRGDEEGSKKYRRYALIVPALIHGMYDFLASLDSGFATLAFIAFIIIMFVVTYRLMIRSSKTDEKLNPNTPFPW